MDRESFSQFLQRSMSNSLPPQPLQQARQQHIFHPHHEDYTIVPFAARLCYCTMASMGAPHSFFADEMHHHRDEQTVYEELSRQPLALQRPMAPNFAFRPLLPTEAAHPHAPQPPSSAHTDHGLRLQIPGVRDDLVKTEDFSPVSDNDWAHALIDHEAPSPASTVSMADSPVTPEFSGSQESFADAFFGGGHHANNPAALAFAEQHGLDTKSFVPQVQQRAPTLFDPPGYAPFVASPADDFLGRPVGYTYHHGLRASPQHQITQHAPAQLLPSTNPLFTPMGYPSFPGGEISMSDSDESTSSRSDSAHNCITYGTSPEAVRVRNRDQMLLQGRRKGWTYKRIKETYHFTEAEPTLRGRHRMLTKDKEDRVRRPVWTRNDVQLLRSAVAHFAGNTRGKLPWKKVGDWVHDNGGSYHFGGSTCAKKWDQLGKRI